MHLVGKNIVERRPLLGALPLSLTGAVTFTAGCLGLPAWYAYSLKARPNNRSVRRKDITVIQFVPLLSHGRFGCLVTCYRHLSRAKRKRRMPLSRNSLLWTPSDVYRYLPLEGPGKHVYLTTQCKEPSLMCFYSFRPYHLDSTPLHNRLAISCNYINPGMHSSYGDFTIISKTLLSEEIIWDV